MEFSSVDTIWVLLAAILVFFMQAGFTMVEIGFTTVFCATTATIISGAMAERTRFSAYIFYSIAMSMIVYPISGHWIWGGGWLADIGFHDFAGSTAVHMVGGGAALVGAWMLGPRIGKYDRNGAAQAIPGQSLDMEEHGIPTTYPGLTTSGRLTAVLHRDAAADAEAGLKAAAMAEAILKDTPLPLGTRMNRKMTMVSIVTRPEKFGELKSALHAIGIMGITVTRVTGCGVQHGGSEYYRGVEIASNLLPKIRLDIVVSKIPVRAVIETAKRVLRTGRTGEEGFDALQYSG